MKILNPRLIITFPVYHIKEIFRRIKLVFSPNNLLELTDKEKGHILYYISIALREGDGKLNQEYGDELHTIYKKITDGEEHSHWSYVRNYR